MAGSMTGSAAKSGRDLVAQYAGHLAHLLNGNDRLPVDAPHVEISAYQLYERVWRGLANNKRFLEGLVGIWSYPPPQDAENAADFYFDQVLNRTIARRLDRPSSADNLRAFIDTHAVGPRLAKQEGELSTWKAMVDGPTKIKRFLDQGTLFQLSNLILKCLDAANRPYAEVLRLGLCPKEWLVGDEEVSVNSLKAANGFLKQLKSCMNGEVGRRPTPQELEDAFQACPIPGSRSGADFSRTPFGAAILARLAGQDIARIIAYDDIGPLSFEADAEESLDLLEPAQAAPLIERAVQSGAIEDDEAHLLAAMVEGRPLAEAMKSNLGLRRRLKNHFEGDVGSYISDLSNRVSAFVRAEIENRP